jgi:hypothetical protein
VRRGRHVTPTSTNKRTMPAYAVLMRGARGLVQLVLEV